MDSPIKINVDLTEENVLCIMPNILNKKWQQFMEIDHTYEFSSEFTDILKSLYLQIQKPKNERKEYNLYLNQIDNCISAVSIISDEAKSLSENEIKYVESENEIKNIVLNEQKNNNIDSESSIPYIGNDDEYEDVFSNLQDSINSEIKTIKNSINSEINKEKRKGIYFSKFNGL